jgi:lipoyl(octanoyl) transferase
MALEVTDLGRMPYARALAVQREVNRAVSRGEAVGSSGAVASLLLVEHDPVVTLTHRPGVWDNLLATPDRLKEMGIDVQVTDRGGDVTYHGPGQLVAYPILQLKPLGLNLGSYMRLLEHVVIDVLAEFGIKGMREKGAIGVWVDVSGVGYRGSGIGKRKSEGGEQWASTPYTPDPRPQTQLAKICALGVRVRKNTTMHGLALNVTTDLSHFKAIDPCGLGGRPVTSLAELLGDRVPGMDEVKGVLVEKLRMAVEEHAAGQAE